MNIEKSCRAYFGERLKLLRAEKGLSQEVLAKELGISKGSLGFYETSKNTPDIEVLDIVSNYFNVSYDYLLGRSADKTREPKMQDIMEYTGLSEESITELHKEKEQNDVNIASIINTIIGYDGIEILSLISSYIYGDFYVLLNDKTENDYIKVIDRGSQQRKEYLFSNDEFRQIIKLEINTKLDRLLFDVENAYLLGKPKREKVEPVVIKNVSYIRDAFKKKDGESNG